VNARQSISSTVPEVQSKFRHYFMFCARTGSGVGRPIMMRERLSSLNNRWSRLSSFCPQCDNFPVSEKVALQLAGLQCQVSLSDAKESTLEYYADVENYIPFRISRTRSSDTWVTKSARYFTYIFCALYMNTLDL